MKNFTKILVFTAIIINNINAVEGSLQEDAAKICPVPSKTRHPVIDAIRAIAKNIATEMEGDDIILVTANRKDNKKSKSIKKGVRGLELGQTDILLEVGHCPKNIITSNRYYPLYTGAEFRDWSRLLLATSRLFSRVNVSLVGLGSLDSSSNITLITNIGHVNCCDIHGNQLTEEGFKRALNTDTVVYCNEFNLVSLYRVNGIRS